MPDMVDVVDQILHEFFDKNKKFALNRNAVVVSLQTTMRRYVLYKTYMFF